MIQLTNILVPVDFSFPSDQAINYGLSFALQFRARLILAHIVPSFAELNYSVEVDAYAHEEKALAEVERRLPEKISAAFRDRVQFKTVAKIGDVRNDLLTLMEQENCDLVIMGTHGRRQITRFLLGSTTEAMIRQASVPVMTVSHISHGKELLSVGPIPFRKILYATDYSDDAKIGLHYAAELARTFGAELMVLHVMDRMEQWGSELLGHPPSDITRVREIASERERELIRPEQTGDLKIETAIVEGSPHHEINKFAEEWNADLIVLNIQSKSALERVMIGATAERVIRSARVPVLSIPTKTGAKFTSGAK